MSQTFREWNPDQSWLFTPSPQDWLPDGQIRNPPGIENQPPARRGKSPKVYQHISVQQASQKIAIRVIGSWVAAFGLLALAWHFRANG